MKSIVLRENTNRADEEKRTIRIVHRDKSDNICPLYLPVN